MRGARTRRVTACQALAPEMDDGVCRMKYPFAKSDERTTAADERGAIERPALAFEAEFDGIRRMVGRTPEPMFNPARYWELKSGGTD
jgi:hypothetical protein